MKTIPGTPYFIDKDHRVFRALKPKVINGKTYYFLMINGKLKRFPLVKLSSHA